MKKEGFVAISFYDIVAHCTHLKPRGCPCLPLRSSMALCMEISVHLFGPDLVSLKTSVICAKELAE